MGVELMDCSRICEEHWQEGKYLLCPFKFDTYSIIPLVFSKRWEETDRERAQEGSAI